MNALLLEYMICSFFVKSNPKSLLKRNVSILKSLNVESPMTIRILMMNYIRRKEKRGKLADWLHFVDYWTRSGPISKSWEWYTSLTHVLDKSGFSYGPGLVGPDVGLHLHQFVCLRACLIIPCACMHVCMCACACAFACACTEMVNWEYYEIGKRVQYQGENITLYKMAEWLHLLAEWWT